MKLLFLSFCVISSLCAQDPTLLVSRPLGEILDKEVKIQVENLAPFQEIKIKATAKDNKEAIWSSVAYFQADAQGKVDLSSSQPLKESSYEDVDAMGLFWSMLPDSGDEFEFFKCKDDCFSIELKLLVDDIEVSSKTVTSYLKSPDVKKIDVRENGLVASLFLPPSDKPLPTIITLSGSNGGMSDTRAKLLASNGFAVLALAYFKEEGLPSNLEGIHLEYFETAFSWLSKNPAIDNSHIGLCGVSRGGELVLLLGSMFPNSIQAIVSIVPSSVVHRGLAHEPTDAWLYKGKPILPFAPVGDTDFKGGKGQFPKLPAQICQSFIDGMQDYKAFEAAAIHVENIQCPLLLISGGDDQMWPSTLFSDQVMDRLKRKESKIAYQHLSYPKAGHTIIMPNLPSQGPIYQIANIWFTMGGSRSADAKASADSWRHLVSFFQESLRD